MTALTVVLGLVAGVTWAWVIGDHFDWWQRAAARRRHLDSIARRGAHMNDLPAEAYGEAWLSLTNEQRTELLSQRRDNQLREKALKAPADQSGDEQPHQPETT